MNTASTPAAAVPAPPPFAGVVEVSVAGAMVPTSIAVFLVASSAHPYSCFGPYHGIGWELGSAAGRAFVIGFALALPVATVVAHLGAAILRLLRKPWILGTAISIVWIGAALVLIDPDAEWFRWLSWYEPQLGFFAAPLVAGLAAAANGRIDEPGVS